MEAKEIRCPKCKTKIQRKISRWFGLIKTVSCSCTTCGAELVFDLAGGVYVVGERKKKMGEPQK